MKMQHIPFGTTDWSAIAPTEHSGETGSATWRTQQFGEIRVRMVEYSPGYLADHWCLSGQLDTELADGRCMTLTPGMSYQVADGAEPHRSRTAIGATLFVVD
jgi:hypothetical protein